MIIFCCGILAEDAKSLDTPNVKELQLLKCFIHNSIITSVKVYLL